MQSLKDHPLRFNLANELHARPFPAVETPLRVVFLALKPEHNAANRDRDADRAHLIALLDRYGADHPKPGSTHHFVAIGKHRLKWESLTELTTYTVFMDGRSDRAFAPSDFEVFPEDWLRDAPGTLLTSAHMVVQPKPSDDTIDQLVEEWFVPQSLAISSVVEGSAVIATDFRMDPAGHVRFAVFTDPDTGQERIGRIIQRLMEIETYKSLSMLGFFRAVKLSPRMGELDNRLSALIDRMTARDAEPQQTLEALLQISADLELLVAQSNFRFGATAAYAALVDQRIALLNEESYYRRQTMSAFMVRRYQPAMRTVDSTEARLAKMVDRATRAGDLLRTQVDVHRSAASQGLLESMNRRADAQLRLQQTVEGLSVVAISYYAVSLAAALLAPIGAAIGIDKTQLTALLVLPVLATVWALIRRIRHRIEGD